MDAAQEPIREEPQPDPAKQRNARKALENYLKKLRNACGTISSVDQWTSLVAELNGILEIYRVEIPAANRGRLQNAMQLGEAGADAISHACSALELEVSSTIQALPKRGCSCGCLAAGILGALAVLLIGLFLAAFVIFRPVPVVVVNEGCSPMVVRAGILTAFDPVLRFFQVRLPEVIDTNEAETFEVMGLPLNVAIDGTGRRSVGINVIGFPQSFIVGEDVADIIVNGFSILGTKSSVNVRGDAPHEVVIICQ